MTTPAAFDRLTSRQRECLRGVAGLRTIGQIAADLGLSESTVRGHLDAANKVLGVNRTADAALLFQQHEAAADPRNLSGQFPRVDAEPPPISAVQQPSATWSLRLPIRPKGARGNVLSPAERLLWIPAIAVLIATGFGMLAIGLEVLTRLIERLQHLVR